MRSVELLAAIVLFCVTGTAAQKVTGGPGHAWQTGLSTKAMIEMPYGKPQLRLALSCGAAVLLTPDWLLASGHVDLLLYHGGMGSPRPGLLSHTLEADLLGSFTLTGGGSYRIRRTSAYERPFPLFYFFNWTPPPLQNPFEFSLSLGTNVIFSRYRKTQRVGFFGLNGDGIQLAYYNDGTPFQKWSGDGLDRWYTGGGLINYTAPRRWVADYFELSYTKFTGYRPGAFEIANHLDLAFVPYVDTNQYKYNKSLLSLSVGSRRQQWMVAVGDYNNTSWDFQHWIHRRIFNGYHRVPYRRTSTLQAAFLYSTNKISQQ